VSPRERLPLYALGFALVVAAGAGWWSQRSTRDVTPSLPSASTVPAPRVAPQLVVDPDRGRLPRHEQSWSVWDGAAPSASAYGIDEAQLPKCGDGTALVPMASNDGARAVGCARSVDGGTLREGPWAVVTRDGTRARGAYRDGKMQGTWERWSATGAPLDRIEYDGGTPHGRTVQFDDDGGVSSDLGLDHGVLHGVATFRFPDGVVKRETWEHGRRTHVEVEGPDGHVEVLEAGTGDEARELPLDLAAPR
jgi:hypothetical protein